MALAVTANGKSGAFDWMEAKSYDEMSCRGGLVYGIVTQSSDVTVWPAAGVGSVDSPLARADEALAKSALLAGQRLFFICLPSHPLEQLASMKEELREDLRRHVRSLPRV